MKSLVLAAVAYMCLSHPNCDRYTCTCFYNYEDISCLSLCPTGFTADTNKKCILSSSTSLISSLFVRNWNFFSPISSSFSYYAVGSNPPVETFDRGIYFAGTNNLLSDNYFLGDNSWVISPTCTLRFIARIAGDGTLFHMYQLADIFKVYITSSQICVEVKLTQVTKNNDLLSYTDQQVEVCTYLTYNVWYIAEVDLGQDLYYISISIGLSGSEESYGSNLFNYYEFLQQSTPTYYEIGSSSNSFKGFLYNLFLDNGAISGYYIYYNFIDCDYPQYYYYLENICLECPSSSDQVLCINDIGHCFSSDCNSCTSFYMNDCDSCSNGQSSPNCGNNYLKRADCTGEYKLYKSVCIYPPTFTDPSDLNVPVFNVIFGTFAEYYGDVFFSGSDPSTYYPFSSPENDDPFPVKSRGLYFNGTQYLQSNTEISLNLDFVVAFWLWPTGLTSVWSSSFLSIIEEAIIKICFYNGVDRYCLSNLIRTPFTDWSFLAAKVNYYVSTKESKFSNILGPNVIEVISAPSYAFYNEPSLVYIGKDTDIYFIGFIYQLIIWNAAEVTYTNYYNAFCVGTSESCALDYNYTMFYNVYRDMIQLCDASCLSGCSKWGTCNLCKESDCSICPDFSSTCTELGTSSCFDTLQLTEEKDCCNIQCKECFGVYYYNCRKCFEGKVLAQNVCVVQCPIGFTTQNDTCLNSNSKSLSLQFGSLKNETFDSIGLVKFVTGGNGYPDFNQYDPIPSYGRGSYFTENSYMQGEEFLLFHTFTLVFYAKVHSPGFIFVKDSSFIKFTSSNLNVFINDFSMTFSISSLDVWSRYALQIQSDIDGNFYSTFYKDYSYGYAYKTDFVFMDTLSPLTIGSSTDSFTGFLYSLSIYNSLSFSEGVPVICTTSYDGTCLFPCDFSSYFSAGSCITCPSCQFGCHANHCNICAVNYCVNCTEVAGECLNCKEEFNLITQQCLCDFGFYPDASAKCQKCSFNCVECVDLSNKCTTCGANTQLVDNVCYCLDSFVEVTTGSGYFECGCPTNSILFSGTCVCADGYARKNNACKPCYQNSLTCSGTEYYQSLTCKDFYILDQGICYASCTLGYQNISQSCVKTNADSNVFNIKFDSKSRPVNDAINGLGIEYSNNQINDLWPRSVLYRGLYFNGNGDYFKFPSPDIEVPVLSYQFSILLCVYFNLDTNTVFVKENSGDLLIGLSASQGSVKATLVFNGDSFSVKSDQSVETREWTYVMLSVSFSGNSFVMVSVNGNAGNNALASQAPFLDFVSSPFVFGRGDSDNFNGFIYLISVYNQGLYPGDVVYDVQMCGSIENSFYCLSNCPITTFYDKTDSTCYNCLPDCELTGCINNSTCTECIDIHCKECLDFETCDVCNFDYELKSGICTRCSQDYYYKNSKCIKCFPGTYSVNNICSTCTTSEYYDSSNKVCEPCMPLCGSCENTTVCLSCVENSEYVNESYCSCVAPYKAHSNLCLIIQTYFNVSVSVNFENKVKLVFTEAVNGTFKETQVELMLDSKSLDFSILQVSEKAYELQIKYPKVVKEGAKLYFNFSEGVVSVNNSTLYNSFFSVTLYPVNTGSFDNLISEAQSYARTGVTSGLAIAFGCSFISWDPTSVFSFLSTAELYYPISIYSLNLPENILEFFSNLRVQSMVPNIFKALIGTSRGSPISSQLNSLGFSRNLILVNIGVNITIGLVFALSYFMLKTLSFSQKLKQSIKSLKKRFEFSVFIRFWVQSYLEFLLGACVCMKYNTFSSPVENFDFFLAVVVMVSGI